MVMDILFVINAIVIVGFLLIWSFMVFRKKNYTLMEIGWPLSLVLATSVSFLMYGSSSIYRRLLVLTVTIWGLRLAFSLYARHWNQPESRRYAKMREQSDSKFSGIVVFGSLFVIPAIIFYIVSLPITIGFLDSQSILVWWQYVGLGLWALGLLIEMGTESQIRRFKSKPENEGQLITKGFWRLSRHPHYFGTALVWWGIFLLSVVDWNNLLGILSPIVMTLYLVYLASRSTIEAEYKEREDLQNYTSKTPQFFPFVTQITAALSGVGRMASKAVSSARKTRKPTEDTEILEPITENDVNPVPFAESTTETAWFKPEIAEDELASHHDEEVVLSEDVSSLEMDLPLDETDLPLDETVYDDSTIEDVLKDNEFATEINDENDSEIFLTEVEGESEAEDLMPLDETVRLIEEEELIDEPLLELSESEILAEAGVTEEPLEKPEISSDEPVTVDYEELNEEPYDTVGEIPGTEIESDSETDQIPVVTETLEEEVVLEAEPEGTEETIEEEKKKEQEKI